MLYFQQCCNTPMNSVCWESTKGPSHPSAPASGGSTLSLTRVLPCLCQLSAPHSHRLEVDGTAPHNSFPIVLFPWVSKGLRPDKLQKDNGICLQVKMTAGTDFSWREAARPVWGGGGNLTAPRPQKHFSEGADLPFSLSVSSWGNESLFAFLTAQSRTPA